MYVTELFPDGRVSTTLLRSPYPIVCYISPSELLGGTFLWEAPEETPETPTDVGASAPVKPTPEQLALIFSNERP